MSTIIATTLSNGSVSVPTATVVNGSAKAWVNFNGTGTIAARDSFNVASLTDNGTGDYTVSFTSAMANSTYAAHGTGSTFFGTYRGVVQIVMSGTSTPSLYSTTQVQVALDNPDIDVRMDVGLVNLLIGGDLA